jgi:glycosyltransferase involved in cell wall biosynthesis
MRIGLFTLYTEAWIAGILYLQCIATALQALPAPERPSLHLFMPRRARSAHERDLAPYLKGIHYFDSVRSRGSLWKRWTGRTSLDDLLRSQPVDVLFPVQEPITHPLPVPWIGWIPDFQHKRLPGFFAPDDLAGREARFQELITRSPHLVVSSGDALHDLHTFYSLPADRVSVYRFGVTPSLPANTGSVDATLQRLGLPRKFLFFPSQYWRHKNHLLLFQALARLRQRGHHDLSLVLSGRKEDYRCPGHVADLDRFVEQEGLSRQIVHAGFLSRTDQLQVLRAAAAVIQPSLFEGWSLLVEECRAWGKRIYLSDIPVHREQNPPGAVYFDPHNADDLANLLERDWASLEPGPDATAESSAAEAAAQLNPARARNFLSIMHKVRLA